MSRLGVTIARKPFGSSIVTQRSADRRVDGARERLTLGRFNIVRIGENSSYIYLEDWFHTISSQSTIKIILLILAFVGAVGGRNA